MDDDMVLQVDAQTMELPCFVLLKSNVHNRYLSHSKRAKGSNKHASLHFSEDAKGELPKSEESIKSTKDEYLSELPYLKFEVETAKTVEGLVHIRTCYNNKYWVRRSEDSNEIVAEANEPEEDQSKWSCTLFKPLFLNPDADDGISSTADQKKMSLLHVVGQRYVGTSSKTTTTTLQDPFHLVACDPAESNSSSKPESVVFTVIDASAMVILPEYVAFMGPNGKYLNSGGGGLQFESSDIGKARVAQRISYSSSTSLGIIDQASGKYWRTSTFYPYILPDDPNFTTQFSPIKVGNYIALKCTSLNKFANSNEHNVLCSSASTISEDAMLRVAEPVRIREIVDATYHLEDTRIYNTSSIEKYNDSRSSGSSIVQTGTFEVEYKVSQTMSWNESTTVNIGVSVSWLAGIPMVGDLGVDISYEHSQTWEWGVSNTEEKTVKYTQNIAIPPGKTVTLKVLAQKAYCDVPFTCKVRDLMTDGTVREYIKTDGLYVGCNEFQFTTIITEDDM